MSTTKNIMEKLKIKCENRAIRWRLLAIFINILLLAGALFTFYFIRQNINIALVNARAITDLKSNATFDILDVQTFEKIEKIIEGKENTKLLSKKIRNIFVYDKSISTTTKISVVSTTVANVGSSTTTRATSTETAE